MPACPTRAEGASAWLAGQAPRLEEGGGSVLLLDGGEEHAQLLRGRGLAVRSLAWDGADPSALELGAESLDAIVWMGGRTGLPAGLRARLQRALKPGAWLLVGPLEGVSALSDALREGFGALEWHADGGPGLVGRKPGLEGEDRYLSLRCDCV